MIEIVESVVTDVTFYVNRLGSVDCKLYIKPVKLNNKIRTCVSVKNLDKLQDSRIIVGDRIKVTLRGVVAQFHSVVNQAHNTKFLIPKTCPSCGSSLFCTKYGKFALVCKHTRCMGKALLQISFYCKSMEIKGFTDLLIGVLYKRGILRDINDLYSLKYKDLIRLPNVDKDSTMSMIYYINKSKCISGLNAHYFAKILSMLSIQYWGWRTSKSFAMHFIRSGFMAHDLVDRLEESLCGSPVSTSRRYGLRDYFKYKNNGVSYKRLVTSLGL